MFFYNSNCSKPNELASLFREIQLDNNKFHFANIAQGFHFQKNVLPNIVSHSESEQPTSAEEKTSIPGDIKCLDVPTLNPSVPILIFVKYIKEDF